MSKESGNTLEDIDEEYRTIHHIGFASEAISKKHGKSLTLTTQIQVNDKMGNIIEKDVKNKTNGVQKHVYNIYQTAGKSEGQERVFDRSGLPPKTNSQIGLVKPSKQ